MLWELWRRLPVDGTHVLTTPFPGAEAFDAEQDFWIRRTRDKVLLPHGRLTKIVKRTADEVGADVVLFDPALPVGWTGTSLGRPYGVVVHGAEVVIPASMPGPAQALTKVLRGADPIIAAGNYVAEQVRASAGANAPITVIPPGVDVDRFVPLSPEEKREAREHFGVDPDARLVVSLFRLVPRKGADRLVQASARLSKTRPDLQVLIGGTGRETPRLRRLIQMTGAPATLMGRVDDDDLPRFFGCADVFAMPCRTRWGGLEQEGFGIVYLEAAACGVPQLAGRSGGASDAVVHGETGLVVDQPNDLDAVTEALEQLVDDVAGSAAMGSAARARVERDFTYDILAERLAEALPW